VDVSAEPPCLYRPRPLWLGSTFTDGNNAAHLVCPAHCHHGLVLLSFEICVAGEQVLGKGHTIRGLEKCDFTPIYEHFMAKKEVEKARSKEVGHSFSCCW